MASCFKTLTCFAVGVFFWNIPATAGGIPDKSSYRELRWEELMPPSWNPQKLFDTLKLDELSDDDPRAAKALEAFAEEWRNAPANKELQGKRIKIPGYVAPLDWENASGLKEFLLVPYFGACIHVPPPPANQIIHITMDTPLKKIGSMAAVWVYGELLLEMNDSGLMGASSYRMKPDKVEAYE
jgi:hypothetical protein